MKGTSPGHLGEFKHERAYIFGLLKDSNVKEPRSWTHKVHYFGSNQQGAVRLKCDYGFLQHYHSASTSETLSSEHL